MQAAHEREGLGGGEERGERGGVGEGGGEVAEEGGGGLELGVGCCPGGGEVGAVLVVVVMVGWGGRGGIR